ncbi:MAG: diaminopimelate epimerase [Thiohalocapsa sp.]
MRMVPFRKMHGLGNDFVVLDGRAGLPAPDAAAARRLADRHTGIGCDQLIVIEQPRLAPAQAFMRIRNADGSEAEACGNAARCVARLLAEESGERHLRLETAAGILAAELLPDCRVAVDMGKARLEWHEIPLAKPMETLAVDLVAGPLAGPACCNIGNPHATFFVDDADGVDLPRLGPLLEHDPLFPQRANIGVAQICGGGRLRLRVWERGAGLTRACGSGACAALVNAHRRGLSGPHATVVLDGGELDIEWRAPQQGGDGHVIMTGAATAVFEGSFDVALLTG